MMDLETRTPKDAAQSIQSMSESSIQAVRDFESELRKQPEQVPIDTQHLIHGGLYARTIHLKKGTTCTGAFIKVCTTFVISGHLLIYTDDGNIEIEGYSVVPASAFRKQAVHALKDTDITTFYATDSNTIEEINAEVLGEETSLKSEEYDSLNTILITGE